jgi:hypothetical protein
LDPRTWVHIKLVSFLLFTDYWPAECFHTTEISGGISRCVSCYGADGCKPLPGDTDGLGPWEDVIPFVPNAVWHQTSPLSWHHT